MQVYALMTMSTISINSNELLCKLSGDMKLHWGRGRMPISWVNVVVVVEWLFGLASYASQVTSLKYTTGITPKEKVAGKGI